MLRLFCRQPTWNTGYQIDVTNLCFRCRLRRLATERSGPDGADRAIGAPRSPEVLCWVWLEMAATRRLQKVLFLMFFYRAHAFAGLKPLGELSMFECNRPVSLNFVRTWMQNQNNVKVIFVLPFVECAMPYVLLINFVLVMARGLWMGASPVPSLGSTFAW